MYFLNIFINQHGENVMNEISNITPMEQLINVMTKDIKEWGEKVLYVERNYYILVLVTGEQIHFIKE